MKNNSLTQARFEQPKRCATYTRYSSKMQDRVSTEDQIRDSRDAAEQKGWTFLPEYVRSDEEKPGQTTTGRTGLEELLELAKLKPPPFDVILVDKTSRLGRNLSDTLPMTDMLKFPKVDVFFVKDNLATWDPHFRDVYISKCQGDERYLRDLGDNVKRGQRGRVARGFVGSGRTYGYRNVPIEIPGTVGVHGRPKVAGVRLQVDDEMAKVVLRTFAMRAEGTSALRIVTTLNGEGVPSTLSHSKIRRRVWRVGTVLRMLANRKYIGQYTWNKHKQVLNPISGRKEMVLRPESEWIVEERPELRIVPQELWDKVRTLTDAATRRFSAKESGGLNRTERSRGYIFSGHLVCGKCGGKIVVAISSGPHSSYGCHRQRYEGTCDNSLRISQRQLQSQLLHYIQERLSSPEQKAVIAAEFTKQLRHEVDKQNRLILRTPDEVIEVKTKRAEIEAKIQNAIQTAVLIGLSPQLKALHDQLNTDLKALVLTPAKRTKTEMFSSEQINAFLDPLFGQLASIIAGDPESAKAEMNRRLGELILMPVETPNGLDYDVSGDLSLFFDDASVMDNSFLKTSVDHCKVLLPIRTRLKCKVAKKKLSA